MSHTHTRKNVAIKLTKHASLILSNNKTKSENFDSFLKEKKLEHPGFPPEVSFLSQLYQKDICGN